MNTNSSEGKDALNIFDFIKKIFFVWWGIWLLFVVLWSSIIIAAIENSDGGGIYAPLYCLIAMVVGFLWTGVQGFVTQILFAYGFLGLMGASFDEAMKVEDEGDPGDKINELLG